MARARLQAADVMIHTTSLCTAVAGMSFISPDLRAEIVKAVADGPAGPISAMASRAVDIAHTFSLMLPDFRGDNIPMFGFAIVGLVITVMMIRS